MINKKLSLLFKLFFEVRNVTFKQQCKVKSRSYKFTLLFPVSCGIYNHKSLIRMFIILLSFKDNIQYLASVKLLPW